MTATPSARRGLYWDDNTLRCRACDSCYLVVRKPDQRLVAECIQENCDNAGEVP